MSGRLSDGTPNLDHVAIWPVTTYQGECVSCPWWSEEYTSEGDALEAAHSHEQEQHA